MSSVLRSLLLAGALLVPPHLVQGQTFATSITPDQIVPPSPSTASGQGTLTLGADRTLSFEITISGLHGRETAASVHGPAAAGSEAEVLFHLPLGNAKTGRLGPLMPAQVAELEAGLWYVTIHSSHHPDGEIRGQIRSALAVEPESWGCVKHRYRGR